MKNKTIADYQRELEVIDRGKDQKEAYTSLLILAIVEEIGEMARAYLAKQGHKPKNHRSHQDETYRQELGDILLAIMKLASIKKVNLDQRIQYSLNKIKKRKKLIS